MYKKYVYVDYVNGVSLFLLVPWCCFPILPEKGRGIWLGSVVPLKIVLYLLDRKCFIFVSLFCKRLNDWCNVGFFSFFF